MSVIDWVVDFVRFAFFDTAFGVVGALMLCVYVRLGVEAIRGRGINN
jgi:hypothetical protein